MVNEVGGGICQVSSTLYYCTLYSNLKITARTNHYFPVAYIESGLDATVSWGAPDFRFENNRTFPVKIVAYVSGGAVTVEIWGTNVDGSTVKMDSTSSGMTTTTYRNVYDKDGNLLTRTQEAVSVYHSHNEDYTAATPQPSPRRRRTPTPPPVQHRRRRRRRSRPRRREPTPESHDAEALRGRRITHIPNNTPRLIRRGEETGDKAHEQGKHVLYHHPHLLSLRQAAHRPHLLHRGHRLLRAL